jgi:hypothetical protein
MIFGYLGCASLHHADHVVPEPKFVSSANFLLSHIIGAPGPAQTPENILIPAKRGAQPKADPGPTPVDQHRPAMSYHPASLSLKNLLLLRVISLHLMNVLTPPKKGKMNLAASAIEAPKPQWSAPGVAHLCLEVQWVACFHT